MKFRHRIRGILRAPRLTWEVLAGKRYRFIYDQMPITARDMSLKKRANLFLSGGNLLRRNLHPWCMPLHMQFELTNYCNLRCPVCPTGIGSMLRQPRDMSPEMFQRVIDQVGPYLLTASLWGWGEPCLHPQLIQILRIARKYGFAVFLSTNGQNLSDERVIEALATEPPTHLIVAIDGLTDETNSEFRKGAKLSSVFEGVRRIRELKNKRGSLFPILHMRFIVMKHNQHQSAHLREFAEEHGFDMLTVRTLSIIDADAPDETHGRLKPDEDSFRAYDYEENLRLEKTDHYCLQPFWFPTVLADGTVVACEQDYNGQMSMGVIDDTRDFRSIWYGRRAREIRKQVRDHPDSLSFCRNCPFRDRETIDCSIDATFINPELAREVSAGA